MCSTIDNGFDHFYGKLFEIYLKIKESLIPDCVKFNNEWQMNVFEKDEIENVLKDGAKEFEQIYPRIQRKTKKCIFVGDTSSGKSSLINAILKCEILSSSFGATSNCFVEIKSSPQKRSFLVINKEEKEIVLLNQLNNSRSRNSLPSGSHIDLFYYSTNCFILRDNSVLIDTPGVNRDLRTNKAVESYCNDSDLVIMTVASNSSISDSNRGFIDRFKGYFPKLNLAIVYNFWDLPDNREDRNEVKLQLTEEAKGILCEQLEYSVDEANERIHFLSAYERILVNRNDEELPSIRRWESRNEAFIRFNAFLQSQMDESTFTKRYNYLSQLKRSLLSVLTKCHSVVSEMRNKINKQSEQIKDKFIVIRELEEEIKTSAASIFPLAFDKFIEEALEIYRDANMATKKDQYKKRIREVTGNKLLNDKLKALLAEIMKKSKEAFKSKIEECIMRTNDEYLPARIFIVENIYFSLYVDELSVEYDEAFINILNKIEDKIKISTGLTIGLTALTVAAGIATCGVAFAILGPIELAIGAMATIGAGGAATGALAAGGTSAAILKATKTSFQFMWDKDAELIKLAWKNLEEELSKSYEKFLNEIGLHIQNSILLLDMQLIEIQYDLDNLQNEMIQFQNISLLS